MDIEKEPKQIQEKILDIADQEAVKGMDIEQKSITDMETNP
jgi:hypothetical protein